MPKTARLTLNDEPWRDLPTEIADLVEGEIDPISTEILESIAHEIPEYQRPLEGRFGRGIRRGVEEALAQFVALIRDPDAGREAGREVYLALGRGEQRAGRTLDSLQDAYRIGAPISRRGASPPPVGGRGWGRSPSPSWPRRSSPTSTSSPQTRSRASPRRRPRS